MVDIGAGFQKAICMGTSGWDCTSVWVVMIVLFFIAAIFRKKVVNDILGIDFSLIGSVIVSEVCFVIFFWIIDKSIKFGALAGLIGMVIGGFFGGRILPDGESDSDFGNYEV